MPTIKKRINVSLTSDVEHLLEVSAQRDEMPVATKAADLIELALELEEDAAWNFLASKRDTKNAKFLSHKKVWA